MVDDDSSSTVGKKSFWSYVICARLWKFRTANGKMTSAKNPRPPSGHLLKYQMTTSATSARLPNRIGLQRDRPHELHWNVNPCAPTFQLANPAIASHSVDQFFVVGHLNVNRLCFKTDHVRSMVHELNLPFLGCPQTSLMVK